MDMNKFLDEMNESINKKDVSGYKILIEARYLTSKSVPGKVYPGGHSDFTRISVPFSPVSKAETMKQMRKAFYSKGLDEYTSMSYSISGSSSNEHDRQWGKELKKDYKSFFTAVSRVVSMTIKADNLYI